MTKSYCVSMSAFAAFLLSVTANGADYTMDTDDAKNTSSITNFNVSGKTHYAISASDNYYITKTLRTPNASTVEFKGGSLHVGQGSMIGCMAISRSSNSSISFTAKNNGLFFEKGRLAPYGNRIKLTLTGLVTVDNTTANNFYIGSDNANNYGLSTTLTGSLVGTDKAYLNFRSAASNNVVTLTSAASGTTGWSEYEGTVKIGRINQSDYPITAEYRNNWTMPGRLIIDTDSYLYPQYGTSHATVGSLVLQDGAILGGRAGSGDNATITVTDKLDIGQNIIWRYTDPIYSGNSYDVPFLVKAAGATGELRAENFVETTRDPLSHECLPRFWFASTPNDDGSETLSFRQTRVVQIKGDDSKTGGGDATGEGDFGSSCLTNTVKIQGGELPQTGADYVVTRLGFSGTDGSQYTGYRVYTPKNEDLPNGTYEFAGESLTIGTNITFRSAATTLKIKSLRLMGHSYFYPRVNNSTPSSLDGDELFVGPVAMNGSGSMIDVYGNLVWTCNPSLTGSGLLMFRANSGSSKPAGTIVLSGLSTNFYGRIWVTATTWKEDKLTAVDNECVKVSDARQLGGALTAFTADALKLENWGTLEATDDVDFSTANRGMSVGNYGQVRVASGKTLTVGNTVTYAAAGELHKAGAGTLAFGAAADAGTGAKLVVDAGTVQANVAAAFAGVDLSFANGTVLIVNTTKDFGEKGVDLSGATTSVKVQLGFAADETEHELSAYPLCTVPEGVTVTVARPKRHFVKLTAKSNGDGTVTYLADVGLSGAAIILR